MEKKRTLKFRFKGLTVERYRSRDLGIGWSCWAEVWGQHFMMTYYDYPKKEAIARFREYVTEELLK